MLRSPVSRWLRAIAAAALSAALLSAGVAHAASVPVARGGAFGVVGSAKPDIGSKPAATESCSFDPVVSCQSTDPTVALDLYYYGDSSACTFSFTVSWGDSTTQNFVVVDPPDGYKYLASHTYPYAATFPISLTGSVLAGDCTATPGSYQFTLLSYVAMGDSYSAGVGAGDYLTGNKTLVGHDCLQSPHSYPELVDKDLGDDPGYIYDPFVFVACNGATILDFLRAQGPGVPAQLSYIDGTDGAASDWVGLVTLTVGGNDADFANVMAYCAVRPSYFPSCQAKFGKIVDADLRTMEVRLADLYTTIKRLPSLAPTARVLVLGYPRFFPNDQAKDCWTGFAGVAPDDVPYLAYFQPSDMKWINASIKRLDDEIRAAAAAAGITYVNAYNAFNGHELCQPNPWLNRVVYYDTSAGIKHLAQTSFHPNAAGQRALAKAAETAIPR